jgi:microcystin-dependent protein
MKKYFALLLLAMIAAAHAVAAVIVPVNGTNYTIPQTNEKGWGTQVTAWIQAISANTLQPSGGTFTLGADVDFGASFGLKSGYLKSRSASPSTLGVLRLGNLESIGWRNAANSANYLLTVDASGYLNFNGAPLLSPSALTPLKAMATDASGIISTSAVTSFELAYLSGALSSVRGISDTATFTNKTISGSANTLSNIALGSFNLGTAGGVLVYGAGGTPVSTSAGTNGQVLTSNGAVAASWQAAGTASPLTTNGDLYYYNTGNARLPVGSSTNILNVNSGLPTWTAAPTTISGSTVLMSQSTIDINGLAQILSGAVDPTVTATSAPLGSKYLSTLTGLSYRKTDAGSTTNWVNDSIGNVSQAYMVGSVIMNTCSSAWTLTGTSFADFGTQTGCTYTASGLATAPSTNLPAIKFASLPAGEYKVEYEGYAGQGSGGKTAYYQFWDGTTTAREISQVYAGTGAAGMASPTVSQSFTYSTAQSNITFSLRARTDASGSAVLAGSAAFPGVIRVYYFPSSSQVVQPTSQTLDVLGQVNYVLGASCPAGSVSANGAAISRSTYAALYNRVGTTYGIGDGTTTFNVPDLRGIFVRGAGTNGTLLNANGTAYSGTLAATQTDQMQGHVHFIGNGTGGSNTGGQPFAGATSSLSSTGPVSDGTNGTPRTGVETRPANMSLTPCISNATMAMPVIANSVVTSSAGVERIERMTLGGSTVDGSSCTTGTCTIWRQSGGFSAVTRISTGVYSLTFAGGAFSAPPTCTCVSLQFSIAAGICLSNSVTSTSGWGLITTSIATPAAAVDSTVMVTCQGPK